MGEKRKKNWIPWRFVDKPELVPKSFSGWSDDLLWVTYFYMPERYDTDSERDPTAATVNWAIKRAIRTELIVRKLWEVRR